MSKLGEAIRAHVDAQMAELERNPPPKPERSACRLSFWFPAVEWVLPPSLYPATRLVEVEVDYAISFCEPSGSDWSMLQAAAQRIADAAPEYPFFLRSDLVSGKHVWPDSVGVIRERSDIERAMIGISEFAEMAIWFADQGMDVWALRELLIPVNPRRAIRGLPVGSEWRLIVREGVVTDESGFYWPADALVQNAGMREPWAPEDAASFVAERVAIGYPDELRAHSLAVVAELGGDWSADWMETTDGWKLIDMAKAEESWIPNPKGSA